MTQSQQRDAEPPEFVVIHFFRAPGGELRCRATDARTRHCWIVDDATDLHRRVCTPATRDRGEKASRD